MESDGCLCKRKFGHRDTRGMHIEERPYKNRARSWPSVSQRQRLQRKSTCLHLDLGLLSYRTMRNKLLWFTFCLIPPSLWYFITAALANIMHTL